MADLADVGAPTLSGTVVGTAIEAQDGAYVRVVVAGIISTVKVVAGLEAVVAGDVVMILKYGSFRYVTAIIGHGAVIPNGSDPAPNPKPPGTGSNVFRPVSTSTWRDGRWLFNESKQADVIQGRKEGSGPGRNHGFVFYGGKPTSLAGLVVTKATVHIRRNKQDGPRSARAPSLRLVVQSTRPDDTFPTIVDLTTGPSLKPKGTAQRFEIPTAWAQDMVDGTRGGLAVSVPDSGDSPHLNYAGIKSWSAAFVMTIFWRRP